MTNPYEPPADDSDARVLPLEVDDTIEIERIGSVIVATFTDSRILDVDRIHNLGCALERLLTDTVKGLVLDSGRVELMSGAVLGKLILVRKQCLSDSIELRLCSLSPYVFEIFKVTRLTKIFVIDSDRTASLSRLLAPEGFPFPSSDADWLVCADWWEERGHESIAQACRGEANRCRASRTSQVSS